MGATRVTAALTAAAAVAIAAAPTAAADNASYLAAVNQFTTPTGADGLLRTGKAACNLLKPTYGLMFGRHPNLVAEIVWEQNPQLERPEAAIIVNAAIDHLCPGVNMLGYAAV